ncbi:hypothetical protein GCM10025865_11430 [Paraoerskovia sediminicola]|uniref:Fibronectin type III-like domain-containing protein n=1 Tax=Paraoerskovia sediminicola TaxID=1138587 RepID=A0ABM8G1D5_9CELL|nr:glycoside hydrolase family 3 C-terminal domain-containing protein [Paraoerskovia sediminicola]BDZ41844.1 hypothetical protein GCM10025865_11430 [Paraoerskovia sediminicola]
MLRVLTQKAELGLLDADPELVPAGPAAAGDPIDLDPPANRALAREVAESSVTLLANDGTLPLGPGPFGRSAVPTDLGGASLGSHHPGESRRVALLGPCAAEPRTFLGCYSFPNHVLSRFPGTDDGVGIPSLLDALRGELAGSEIAYAPGVPVLERDASGIPAAVEAARDADVAVVAVGDLAALFGRGTSGEGCDAEDLRLPGLQHDLVEAVLATGTPVVLVVVSGRPYALGGLAERCAAVVQAFMPGEEGGEAIARVLSGAVNPSGRLPVGVPRTSGGQPGTYLAPVLGRFSDGVSNLDPTPLYPFGHGISYARFEYEDLELSAASVPADGSLTASVRVANSGERDGVETVQLYLSDDVAQVVQPVRRLVGFARVPLAAGEAATVTFTLHADRTAFTGVEGRRVVEPGWFGLGAGRSSEDLPAAARFEITGEPRFVDRGRVLTTPVTISRG